MKGRVMRRGTWEHRLRREGKDGCWLEGGKWKPCCCVEAVEESALHKRTGNLLCSGWRAADTGTLLCC